MSDRYQVADVLKLSYSILIVIDKYKAPVSSGMIDNINSWEFTTAGLNPYIQFMRNHSQYMSHREAIYVMRKNIHCTSVI